MEIQFSEEQLKQYLNLPNEEQIISVRQHWFVLFTPIISWFLLSIFSFIFISYLGSYIASSLVYWGLFATLFISLTIHLLSKIILDWYLHFYIVTNKRIMEVRISPFFQTALMKFS